MLNRASKKALFIKELRSKGTVFHAAHVAGIARRTAYQWRSEDKKFASEWDQAKEDNLDELEKSLFERAVHGVEKPVYQQGQLVGTIREYSDTAAIFMLKGGRPEKFRERFEHELGDKARSTLADLVKRAAGSS